MPKKSLLDMRLSGALVGTAILLAVAGFANATTITQTFISLGNINITNAPDCVVSQDGTGDFNTSSASSGLDYCFDRVNVSGGDIFFKSGIYTFDYPVVQNNANNIRITGSSGTVFNYTLGSDATNANRMMWSNSRNIEVSNLRLNGSYSIPSGNGGLFFFRNISNLGMNSLKTEDSNSIIGRIFYFSNVSHLIYRDNYVKVASTNCIIDSSGFDHVYSENYFQNNNTGCLVAFGSLCQSKITYNTFSSNNTAYSGISLEEFANWCDPSRNISYANIVVSSNNFDGVTGVSTVDRSLNYTLEDIVVDHNTLRGGKTPISILDHVNRISIDSFMINTTANFHAIKIADDQGWNNSQIRIANNFIYNLEASGGNAGILIANATEVMIQGNAINSPDCVFFNGGVSNATITGNVMNCENKAFRIAGMDNIFEQGNRISALQPFSWTGGTGSSYMESFNYTSYPICNFNGMMNGKSVTIYNSSSKNYNLGSCINGTWYNLTYGPPG